ERLMRMPPAERRRTLDQLRRWRDLTPRQRDQIRRRLRRRR
ncbi:MAG: DUF3106 domain-containing protein, partial [Candidatus Dadabacteria bacterium]